MKTPTVSQRVRSIQECSAVVWTDDERAEATRQIRNAERDAVEDLWFEFTVDDLCGLCGNWGKISITTTTPAGKQLSIEDRPCICPNGRSVKYTGGITGHVVGIQGDDPQEPAAADRELGFPGPTMTEPSGTIIVMRDRGGRQDDRGVWHPVGCLCSECDV